MDTLHEPLAAGVLIGVLIGGAHFGGDGRQPQITLKMHVRHEALFRWLERLVPGSKLYGPYQYERRAFFQWMARGECLREHLVPLLDAHLRPELDAHVHAGYLAMKARYGIDAPRRHFENAAPESEV
jgi:hypothetical protein